MCFQRRANYQIQLSEERGRRRVLPDSRQTRKAPNFFDFGIQWKPHLGINKDGYGNWIAHNKFSTTGQRLAVEVYTWTSVKLIMICLLLYLQELIATQFQWYQKQLLVPKDVSPRDPGTKF